MSMKKLLFLFLVLFTVNAYASPDNSMSITPVAVTGAKITASDENSRNTVISAAYNAHDHTDISRTANTLNIGDGAAGDKIINAYNADTNKPFIKYDDTADTWGISTNGVAPSIVMNGTSLTFEGATDDAFETTLSITEPTADRTITIPNANGVVLPTGAVFFKITGSCPAGTTDVTATYSNKFLRVNATQGSTGGSDTVTIAEANLPSHTHTGPSHTHTGPSHTHAAGSLTGGAHTHGIETYRADWNNPETQVYQNSATMFPALDGATHNDAWIVDPQTYVRAASAGAVAVTGSTGAEGTGATGAAGTGATGAIGSGTATTITNPYVTAKLCLCN